MDEPVKEVREAPEELKLAPVQDTPPPVEAPQPPRIPVDGQPKRRDATKVLLAICLSLVVILNAMAIMWWKDHSTIRTKTITKTITVAPEKTKVTCGAGLMTFQNQDLGFGFCYPSGWGAATLADYNGKSDDIGKRWKITFADQPTAQVTTVSDNWSSTAGSDGTCTDPSKTMPSFSAVSSTWKDGARVVETSPDKFFIREYTTVSPVSGVCLKALGYIKNGLYNIASASYAVPYNATVKTPAEHAASPNKLITEQERAALKAIVLSLTDLTR